MSLSDEDFVSALYRGVLGREPDHSGFRHHVDALAGAATAETAAAMLRGVIASHEFSLTRNAADALAALQPAPQGPVFAHAVALGTDCYASWTLKQMKLKRYSLPFDWLFSSLPMVLHCLQDDFATFLDPRHYRPNAIDARPSPEIGLCDHAFYAERFGIRHVFNHYDPSVLEWHAYLVRAVARLRRLMASPAPKLFLCTVKTADPQAAIPVFRQLAEALDARTENACLEVIAIQPPAQGAFSRALLDQAGPHSLIAVRPYSGLNGLIFEDGFDELFIRRMLAEHRFDLAGAV